jgi:RNA polymerase sigma-B factor
MIHVRYSDVEPLFRELAAGDRDSERFHEVRDRLVTAHLPVAWHIADRFGGRGESTDDLHQVAAVGLIHAIDRFDVGRGIDFLAYAVPTITGEIRRYFRDLGWMVRVPRKLKELCLAIDDVEPELGSRLGRSPTPSELAARLGVSTEEVYEGLHAISAYRLLSLDDLQLDDRLWAEDHELEIVELHHALSPLLHGLPRRERRIVLLRFFENKTQSEIARTIGVSQMHVSRLLAWSLARMRELLEEE